MNRLLINTLASAGVISFGSTMAYADTNDSFISSRWEGFYAGLSLGVSYGSVRPDTTIDEDGGYFSTNGNVSDETQINPILQRKIEDSSLTGSLLLGYNIQSDNLVYGIEADLTGPTSSMSETATDVTYDTVPSASFTTKTTVDMDFSLSIRPKVGYVSDNFLLYVSAGPSIARFKTTHHYTDTYQSGTDFKFIDTKTSLGLSASIGADYEIADDWIVRGDYVYSYYSDILDGDGDVDSNGIANDIHYDASFASQNIRLSVIKKF